MPQVTFARCHVRVIESVKAMVVTFSKEKTTMFRAATPSHFMVAQGWFLPFFVPWRQPSSAEEPDECRIKGFGIGAQAQESKERARSAVRN